MHPAISKCGIIAAVGAAGLAVRFSRHAALLPTPFAVFREQHTAAKIGMAPATLVEPFEVSAFENFAFGRQFSVVPEGSEGPTMIKGKGWSLPRGAYTAQQVVQGLAPLLETVLHHLGDDPKGVPTARHMLIDNMESVLSLGTRESSLHIPSSDAGRAEIAEQARKIGKTLMRYVRDVDPKSVSYDPQYSIRSPCEGHLLKPPVANLMFGPRSLGHLMQIYNEYMHQMVLLRDSLLCFENYEDVIIPIKGGQTKPRLGLRTTERARTIFLAELVTKSITQKAVLEVGRQLLAPDLDDTDVYGFQYEYGSVLPSFIVGGKSLRLLSYVPARFDDSQTRIAFCNEYPDYYTAEKVEIPEPTTESESNLTVERGQLVAVPLPEPTNDTGCLLKLSLELSDGKTTSVDLGQVAKGRRYAYTVPSTPVSGSRAKLENVVGEYNALELLSMTGPGLATSMRLGIHLVYSSSYLVTLAMLGKLYPENVVVLGRDQHVEEALGAGKGLRDGPQFVIKAQDAALKMPLRS